MLTRTQTPVHVRQRPALQAVAQSADAPVVMFLSSSLTLLETWPAPVELSGRAEQTPEPDNAKRSRLNFERIGRCTLVPE
jgi:hypothetical protein